MSRFGTMLIGRFPDRPLLTGRDLPGLDTGTDRRRWFVPSDGSRIFLEIAPGEGHNEAVANGITYVAALRLFELAKFEKVFASCPNLSQACFD